MKVSVFEKQDCSGCGACCAICPKQCIRLVPDNQGFLYPEINDSMCINCGACERVCPWKKDKNVNNNKFDTFKEKFYATQLKNKIELNKVSSGGAAYAISKYFILNKGIVYGAVQFNVDRIVHSRISDIDSLKLICKSKYFQSDISNVFISIKEDLKEGKKVLFTGTGCQIAAVKAFLNRDYDNLYTLDVVCHGVPSPLIWKSYRAMVEEKYNSKMTELIFRDKSKGWNKNQYKETYDNGLIVKQLSTRHPFHRGYLLGFYSRPCCSNCKFCFLPRVSDITVADYWKYNGKKFKKFSSLGVSLVCCNTKKGIDVLNNKIIELSIEDTTRKLALNSCRHLNNSPKSNLLKNKFNNDFNKYGFEYCYNHYIKEKTIFERILNKMRCLYGR